MYDFFDLGYGDYLTHLYVDIFCMDIDVSGDLLAAAGQEQGVKIYDTRQRDSVVKVFDKLHSGKDILLLSK